MPEEGGATHVYRYHRRKPPEMYMYSDIGHDREQVQLSIVPGHACSLSRLRQRFVSPCGIFLSSDTSVTQHSRAQQTCVTS